jgi:hypothetical protein
MDRRELFPILAAVVTFDAAAQHEHHKPALVSTAGYKRQVFNDQQNQILDQLADIIIPTDAGSPGASQARVSQYFDLVATYVKPVRTAFEEGLQDFNTLALANFEAPLAKLTRAQLTTLLETAAAHEGNPTNGAESFFELLKFHTVEGYRLSHIGQTQWLGYKPHAPGLYPDLTVD